MKVRLAFGNMAPKAPSRTSTTRWTGYNRNMFYYVYIIQSEKNQDLYVGYTTDLKARLERHNKGFNVSTKPYRPWQLIHYEAYRNEDDAKRREKYLKTSQGSRLLKRMLKEYFYSQKLGQ